MMPSFSCSMPGGFGACMGRNRLKQNQISGLSSSGGFLNTCPLKAGVQFENLPGLSLPVQGTGSSCGQENLYRDPSCVPSALVPGSRDLVYIYSCLSHFACGLLGPKCNTGNNYTMSL